MTAPTTNRLLVEQGTSLNPETPVDQVPPGAVVQEVLPNGRRLYFVGGTRVDAVRFRDAHGLQPWEVWDTWLAQLCWGRSITIGRLFRIHRAGAH